MTYERVLTIVADGCGAGATPDSIQFGDDPKHPGNTLVHVAASQPDGLAIPNLRRLGLGHLVDLKGPVAPEPPVGSYGRLQEASMGGKDTVTGHWEMMGIVVQERFPTYPEGFPRDLLDRFEAAIGRSTLGNRPASGTVIIDELGADHMKTGSPIVYTSADSVFQIACHEGVIPIEEQYRICEVARQLLAPPHALQRVIARPFESTPDGGFRRTERRKDFPLEPPRNALDSLSEAGVYTAGIGVIPEVFGGRGFSYSERTQTNEEHYLATMKLLESGQSGFFFINFEDFDMLYGHRLDPNGFAAALETFDGYLEKILAAMGPKDLLMITADHGNDPTIPSTDHTREYVPLLLYSPGLPGGHAYGDRSSFADVGATVLEAFGLPPGPVGRSLLEPLRGAR